MRKLRSRGPVSRTPKSRGRTSARYARVAPVVAILAATACAAPTAPRPVPELPARATPAEAVHFDEPLAEEALVREVLARNPSLRAMREAWRAARERYPQVTALEDPQLSYGLAPATIGSRRFDVGHNIDLSQSFPWPGKLSSRGESAQREADAAGEDVAATRLRLVEAAHEAFYDWWYVHRAIAINEKNQDFLAEIRRVAEVRYSAALASKQDALQAEVEHQHLVHRGVVLERMREIALARLNTLLNRPPKASVPPPPAAVRSPGTPPPREQLEADAVRQRPVLRAQRQRIEARKADVRLAGLETFPNLRVMGTYNSLWEADELQPMIGIGINVPIQLERRRAALDEARARLHQAESLLEEKRAEVLFEVNRAYDELREQEHVVRLYGGSIIPAAEESLSAARSGYETATNDFLTLIQAEKTLLTAELTREQGLAEYHKARARLERAAGARFDGVGDKQ